MRKEIILVPTCQRIHTDKQSRRIMVEILTAQGWSASRIAKILGIGKSSVYRLRAQTREMLARGLREDLRPLHQSYKGL